jgi:ABC-type glycerol-3-phosphate transport system permease component
VGSNNSKIIAKKIFLNILKYVVLLFFAFVVIVPILFLVFSAFKTDNEYASLSKIALPGNFLNVSNFIKAFTKGNMMTAFRNTVIILVVSLTGSILFGAMVGYVMNRFNFVGKKFIMGLFYAAMLIPMVTTQVATYQIVVNFFHLQNSLLAPMVLYLGADVVNIYIMLQFINAVPVSIDESAMLDGASYPYIFFKMILPNLKPAIATIAIIKGVAIYNDFYIPYLYCTDPGLLTMSTSLYAFKGPYSNEWNVVCAGVILVMIPTLIAFLFLQKYIYNGFVSGAVKS